MILGRGTATTDEAIVTEYRQFVTTTSGLTNAAVRQRLQDAPAVMGRRLGKPLAQWTEEDILTLFVARAKATHYYYCAFVAFLLFRGYRRASLAFLLALPCHLCRLHRPSLQPYRQKLEAAQRELSY
ncbi:MAG TPA: hypothetical protein VGJ87_07175, partial [Roseiflexaceae bacterium]